MGMNMRWPENLIFASGNRGKYLEVLELFAPLGVNILFGCDKVTLDVNETGDSYAANALIKARAFAFASGMPALADDSGLEIRSLEWAPGLLSARVASTDKERIAIILERMERASDRYARYVAAFALFFPEEGLTFITEGVCPGEIHKYPAGVRGFGYDPVFSPCGYDKTFGELSDEIKRKISHRAIAGCKLMDILSGNCVVK